MASVETLSLEWRAHGNSPPFLLGIKMQFRGQDESHAVQYAVAACRFYAVAATGGWFHTI